jgi:catechol 2,3-dioxygenase-like lactoylglutathione lyase family enzyme
MSDTAINCLHMNHLNVVVHDFDASVARLGELLGARFNADMPQDEWHAGLINLGGVLFEVFSPKEFLLNARYGPHYVGIEYQVPDVSDARRAVLDKGLRIVRDIGLAIHTHPADTFGVALEFFDKNFHAQENPRWIEPFKPLEYWRDEHPLGCTGLKRYSVAVADLDAATRFFEDFLGAKVLYETQRPAAVATARGLALADSVVEIMTPVGSGVVEDHLGRYGDGIRSTVFEIGDLDKAQRYFTDRGVAVHAGDADDTFAIAAEDACGVLFEFSE